MTPEDFRDYLISTIQDDIVHGAVPGFVNVESFSHESARIGLVVTLDNGEKHYASVVRTSPPGGD